MKVLLGFLLVLFFNLSAQESDTINNISADFVNADFDLSKDISDNRANLVEYYNGPISLVRVNVIAFCDALENERDSVYIAKYEIVLKKQLCRAVEYLVAKPDEVRFRKSCGNIFNIAQKVRHQLAVDILFETLKECSEYPNNGVYYNLSFSITKVLSMFENSISVYEEQKNQLLELKNHPWYKDEKWGFVPLLDSVLSRLKVTN